MVFFVHSDWLPNLAISCTVYWFMKNKMDIYMSNHLCKLSFDQIKFIFFLSLAVHWFGIYVY